MAGALYLPLVKEDLHPTEAELAARLHVPLGYRDAAMEETERALLCEIRPAMTAVRVKISRPEGGGLLLGDLPVCNKGLEKNLEGCGEAFLFAVTLGLCCERWLKKVSLLSPAKHFLADGLASAYAEAAADLADAILSKDLDTAPRFSPGYGDLPLSIQKDLIRVTEANKYLHIELKDNLLMVPQKSVTAILGIRTSAEGREK